jgi:GGDEF domain-containing protein
VQHLEVQRVELPDGAHARLYLNISREIAYHDGLRQHILTDPDTGLLNRRGIMLALEPQVARSRRYNRPISVIVLEVSCAPDDAAIRKQIAQQLKDQLRWADTIGCTGPREFLLVLPETTEEAALQLVDKLKTCLNTMPLTHCAGHALPVYFGVTSWKRNDNASSLLTRATAAVSRSRDANNHQAVGL